MKFILIGTHSAEWIARPKERGKLAHAKAAELNLVVEANYFTQGQYDYFTVMESPDPESVSAFSLWYMQQGFGRVQTMLAYSPAQMFSIIEKQSSAN